MHGSSFFFDEWDFVLHRGINFNDLMRPHNGHFSLLPVFLFSLTRHIFGLSNYLPYQVLAIVVHVGVSTAAYFIVRRSSRLIALGVGIVVVCLGSGWQNILWPFQIGMMGAFAAGLWAIFVLENETKRPWLVSLLLAVSLASAGGGIAFAVVLFCAMLVKRDWQVIRALTPTLGLYAIWYLKYGESQSHNGNLGKTPKYVLDSALAAGAGIGGRTLIFGAAVLGVVGVLFIQRINERSFVSTKNLIFVFLIATWTLTALSRAHLGEPGASRYVYVGAISILILAGILLPPFESLKSSLVILPSAILLLIPNLDMMRAGANGLKDTSAHLSAEQAALEQIIDEVPADFQFDSMRAPQLRAGEYLRAVEKFGSPAMSWSRVRAMPAAVIVDVNKTILNATSSFQLSEQTTCNEDVVQGEVEISTTETLLIKIAKKQQLGFNWINRDLSSSFVIDVNEPGIYSVRNPGLKSKNSLQVSGELQSISVCKP